MDRYTVPRSPCYYSFRSVLGGRVRLVVRLPRVYQKREVSFLGTSTKEGQQTLKGFSDTGRNPHLYVDSSKDREETGIFSGTRTGWQGGEVTMKGFPFQLLA